MPKYETPGPVSVTLELGTGNVRVTASNRTDTVVEVRPSSEADESDVKTAQQVRVDFAGGMLRVTGPKPGAFDFSRKSRSVDVSIELPSDSEVSLDTLAGDVRCVGRLGECKLRTSAGTFWLEQTGPLRLKTGFGHVTADGIAGSADISTSSGKVQIGEVEGTAVIRSSNGAISVDRAGAGVDAKTSNGGIRLGEVARGSIVLGTPAGDLEIGVAEGTAAWLEMSTGHGDVYNLLENVTGPQEADNTVEVHARTSYGDITIRRS
jgi:putative adhesin